MNYEDLKGKIIKEVLPTKKYPNDPGPHKITLIFEDGTQAEITCYPYWNDSIMDLS